MQENFNNQHKNSKIVLQVEKNSSPFREEENVKPIRFLMDFSKLEKDDYRLCEHIGQSIFTEGDIHHLCSGDDVLTTEKRDYYKTRLVPYAIAYLRKALNIYPTERIRLIRPQKCPKGCNFATDYNETYYTEGVENVDFIFMVTARPTEGNVIAYAITLDSDKESLRPILGQMNFGPNQMNLNPRSFDEQVGVTIHESKIIVILVTHALGFSSSHYRNYIDRATKRRYNYTIIVEGDDPKDSKFPKRTFIKTPKVVKTAQDHFDCDGIDGVPFEDFGGSGTAGSHWEKRLFQNEYMTGTAPRNPVFSEFTLALFEDMGWYTPNYTYGQPLAYGKGMGCDFYKSSCSKWNKKDLNKTNINRYTCFDDNGEIDKYKMACTYDRASKGYCSLFNYDNDLPSQYQHLSDKKKGGTDEAADYCPLILPFPSGSCKDIGVNPTIASAYLGEETGRDSLCFESTYPTGKDEDLHSACHRAICDEGGQKIKCENGRASAGKKGYVICPHRDDVCDYIENVKLNCNNSGIMIQGECLCVIGKTGEDCSNPECPLGKDDTPCSGEGICEKNATCTCNPTRRGDACERPICSLEGDKDCSGHGGCIFNETGNKYCMCTDLFEGEKCELRTCKNTTSPCDKKHGITYCTDLTCFNPDSSKIDDDFDKEYIIDSVDDLEIKYYTTTYPLQLSVRSGNITVFGGVIGTYISTMNNSFIENLPGDITYYYILQDKVFGILGQGIYEANKYIIEIFREDFNCSGNGKEIEEDVQVNSMCDCDSGYTGIICQQEECIEQKNCHGNGVCMKRKCSCYGGWEGEGCNTAIDSYLNDFSINENHVKIESNIISTQSISYFVENKDSISVTIKTNPSNNIIVTAAQKYESNLKLNEYSSEMNYIFYEKAFSIPLLTTPLYLSIHSLDAKTTSKYSIEINRLNGKDCSTTFCNNHGKCENKESFFSCSCDDGFAGSSCEYEDKKLNDSGTLKIKRTTYFNYVSSFNNNFQVVINSTIYIPFLISDTGFLDFSKFNFYYDFNGTINRNLVQTVLLNGKNTFNGIIYYNGESEIKIDYKIIETKSAGARLTQSNQNKYFNAVDDNIPSFITPLSLIDAEIETFPMQVDMVPVELKEGINCFKIITPNKTEFLTFSVNGTSEIIIYYANITPRSILDFTSTSAFSREKNVLRIEDVSTNSLIVIFSERAISSTISINSGLQPSGYVEPMFYSEFFTWIKDSPVGALVASLSTIFIVFYLISIGYIILRNDFNKEALKYVPFIQVDPEVLDPNYVKPEEVVEEAEDIKIPPTNHEELEVVIPAKPIATGNRKPSDVKVVTIKTVNNPEEDSRSNCDNKNIELNRSAYNRESNRIQSRRKASFGDI